MKRKILSLLLACMLLAGLCTGVFAEAQLFHVTDTAGLLTADEDYALEEQAAEISARYGCGLYIVTVDDYTDFTTEGVYEAAYTIYHDNSLGEGSDRNGVILLLSMKERDYATFFYGPVSEYAFCNYAQELVSDEFLDNFKEDDWYGGFSDFLRVCAEDLQLASEGNPVRESKVGVVILCLLASMLVALIVCLILKAKMRTVHRQVEAASYATGTGLKVTRHDDRFTHTTQTRTKIERESSSGGGGGGHTGGGGSGQSGKF